MSNCMKRGTSLLLALLLALSVSACARIEGGAESGSEAVSSDPVSSREETPSSEISSEMSSEYPSSEQPLSSKEVSSVASVVSKIQSANTASKASSKAASSKPASSAAPSSSAPASSETPSSKEEPKPQGNVSHDTMKAVWLSYLEFQAFKGSTEGGFTSKISSIFDNIVNKGLNTVIVQVRPFGDSFYDSAYYPWSKCASGTAGMGLDYDPLAIMVEEAHARGLEIHAWLNPYRTMTDKEFAGVDDSYPTKQWYNSSNRSDYMIPVYSANETRYWLQPGNAEVRRLIVDGAKEIVRNYAVDGIHLDDYFYGTSVSSYGDTASQAKANTTALIKGLHDGIKSVKGNVKFGVSPSGSFSASASAPNSDLGYLSTDLALWCSQPGYLDYVMPQIYWDYTESKMPFTRTLNKWEDFVVEDSVALYIGLAPYRISGSSVESQAQDSLSSWRASGYCLFRYDHIGSLTLP